MKIKSIAAVGAMGVGLGLASFVGGTGTASAETRADDDPPIHAEQCRMRVPIEQTGEFLRTISPQYNVDVLLNGQNENRGADPTTNNGLGHPRSARRRFVRRHS